MELQENETIYERSYYCDFCKKYSNINLDNILICGTCGVEQQGIIDTSPEWHNYKSENTSYVDPSRCGSIYNPLLIESSYGTIMGYTNNPLYIKMKQYILWNSIPYADISKNNVFKKLEEHSKKYGILPNIIERSKYLYSEIADIKSDTDEKSSRGNYLTGLISACTYEACKEFNVAIFPKDIASIYGISQKDVTKGINLFRKIILHSKNEYVLNSNTSKTYSNYVTKYCEGLNINNPLVVSNIEKCLEIIDKNNLLPQSTYQSIICGTIYFVSVMLNLQLKKDKIAEVCKISTATINKTYNILIEYTDILI